MFYYLAYAESPLSVCRLSILAFPLSSFTAPIWLMGEREGAATMDSKIWTQKKVPFGRGTLKRLFLDHFYDERRPNT